MKIENIEVGSAIRDNMMSMSVEVLTNRAIPFLEDGFKPSQRKLLYTMKTMNLFNKLAKSADIEGQNMKILPHSGAYKVAVRMTREAETLLTPFIYGKGSFGKIYSSTMEAAAPRYTEMSLAPICHEMFDKLHMHESNMVDNYNKTMKEPKLLSLPFPNILANSQSGIGIGFATDFPSFNLVELCDACISTLNKKDFKLTPDFTTGAYLLLDDEELDKINNDGSGKITLRAKLENDEKNKSIIIKEIPYTTNIEAIMKSIYDNYDKGNFNEIIDVVDEIGINGFKLTIDYKKNTNVEELINKLYLLTPLQSVFACNMTLVYNKRPVRMGVKEIIEKWIEHRKSWVKEEIEYETKEKEEKLHFQQGLAKILVDIDKAIEIVKNSKSDEEVINGLKAYFNIDDIQAEYVANIKLRNLNEEYVLSRMKDIDLLKNEIKKLKSLDVVKVMIEDLERVKSKYGIPRKTEILSEYENLKPINKESKKIDLEATTTLFIGKDIKRINGESKAKTPAHYERLVAKNKDSILLFTNQGRCFKIPFHKIKQNITHEFEGGLIKFKELEVGEKVIAKIPYTEETLKQTLFIIYKEKAVRLDMNCFDSSRRIISKGIRPDAVDIRLVNEEDEFSVNGIDFKVDLYSITKSRLSQGVKFKKVK